MSEIKIVTEQVVEQVVEQAKEEGEQAVEQVAEHIFEQVVEQAKEEAEQIISSETQSEIKEIQEGIQEIVQEEIVSELKQEADQSIQKFDELKVGQLFTQLVNQLKEKINSLELEIKKLADLKKSKERKFVLAEIFQGVPDLKKTALLCGLNYPGTSNSLRGCINDVNLMSGLLVSSFSYPVSRVQVKTDSDLIGDLDVLDYLKQQAENCKFGDTIFFHYSGHGLQIPDEDGDEKDGMDEAIYTHHGVIVDDEIAKVFQLFPVGVKVIAIFDCCNSGSIADLPYRYRGKRLNIEQDSDKKFMADIIVLSGSIDPLTSADAWVSERKQFYGALTSNVAKLIEQKLITGLTWKELVDSLQISMRNQGFTQIPQASSNRLELFDEKVHF